MNNTSATTITITKDQIIDLAYTLGKLSKFEQDYVNVDSTVAFQSAEQVIEQLDLFGKVNQGLFWSNFKEAGDNQIKNKDGAS